MKSHNLGMKVNQGRERNFVIFEDKSINNYSNEKVSSRVLH